MSKDLHSKLKSEYTRRRDEALLLSESRKMEAYQTVEGLKELDMKIAKAGIDAAKKVLAEPNRYGDISREVDLHINNLKKQKCGLLESYGYPSNFTEPQFLCKSCEDTGVAGGKLGDSWCHCYRQRLIEGLFEESGLARDKMASFDRCKQELFSVTVDEGRYEIKLSPRENFISNKEKCQNFVKHGFYQTGGKGLLFTGQTGTGKTFLAECIARELIQIGKTVAFVSAAAMFDKINESKMVHFGEDNQDDYFGLLKEADLLIIDDLGTETPSEAKLSNLLQLLNVRARLDQMSPHKTIISTNLKPAEIRNRYDDRISSRIIGSFMILKFGGEDLRIKTR